MMTDEQCIEIAEKVWGWVRLEEYQTWDAEGRHWSIHSLVQEVNSWRGFGRTVEAMAERKYRFNIVVDSVCFDLPKGRGNLYFSIEQEKPKTIITATHLSALEALNDKR